MSEPTVHAASARLPIVHLARVVLELQTPLSIGTGNPDGVFDTALMRDANGLPALPASSLAGVLRSLDAAEYGPEHADALFGWQRGAEGAASRVQIGWGAALDSEGRAAWGLLLGKDAGRLADDPLLHALIDQQRQPLARNRVRLSHKGAAADTGKFDRTVVPAGCRFAFELRLLGHAGDDPAWPALLALLAHPGLRLGGATRAGLGAVHCVSLHTGVFDLRDPQQARAVGRLGADPSEVHGLHSQSVPTLPARRWSALTLHLAPENLWRVGGDGAAQGPFPDDKEPDLAPVREARVAWNAGKAQIGQAEGLYLPAASLKGVLAHRMAFHARRYAGEWNAASAALDADIQPPTAVRALFGDIKSGGPGRDESGAAGALFIDDAWLDTEPSKLLLTHNAIDRFTGGVREHMLFTEQVAQGGKLRVRIALDAARLQRNARRLQVDVQLVQRAFDTALADLCEGRLGLGARSATGLGFCKGRVEPDAHTLWAPLNAPDGAQQAPASDHPAEPIAA